MSRLAVIASVVACIVSFCGGLLLAQTGKEAPAPPNVRVLSGTDVGVRLDNQRLADGTVLGTLVVKINGQWVAVSASPKLIGAGK